jgi:hypothetical protein
MWFTFESLGVILKTNDKTDWTENVEDRNSERENIEKNTISRIKPRSMSINSIAT